MSFMGIGLHIIVAIFFAVHVVRTGREMYWLLILFMFPLLGSVVYLVAVYLPESRLQHKVSKTVSVAARSLDPGRALREARQAFELTPTAQNQMRLANALLETGATAEAAEHFEACLKGPFSKDPEIRFGAANARLQNGQGQAALELALAIRQESPAFGPEQVSLLLAKAYASIGCNAEAKAEYAFCHERFGSTESKVEYAIWALQNGEVEIANRIQADIDRDMKHWNKHARTLNKALINRMNVAFANGGKR